MKLLLGSVVFALFVTVVRCGVIDEVRANPVGENEEIFKDAEDDCVTESEEHNLQSTNDISHDGHKRLGSAKKKRCPTVGSIHRDDSIVGAATPQIDRRDIHNKLSQHLCSSCRNAPTCKVHNNCAVCETWCGTENTPENISQPDTVGASLSMASRSNFGVSSEKNTYTIEPIHISPMKGTILRLLGISNIEDIDDMGIWVTTVSEKPPMVQSKNHAEKILKLCHDAGSELKEEAKKGARDTISLMWLQLQKELEKRILERKEALMTKTDVIRLIQNLFRNINIDSVVSNSQVDSTNLGSSNLSNEILSRNPEPETFIMPQEMNPDIIEGPPNNTDEQVGAINQELVDNMEKNQVNPEGAVRGEQDKTNSRMQPPLKESEPLEEFETPVSRRIVSPPLEEIGAKAIDLMREVSEDVAKQGHKINHLYGDLKNHAVNSKSDTPVVGLGKDLAATDNLPSESEKTPIRFEKPIVAAGEPVHIGIESRIKETGSEIVAAEKKSNEDLNEAFWNQRMNKDNSQKNSEDLNIPTVSESKTSKVAKQSAIEFHRPLNKYKGKIDYPNKLSPTLLKPRVSKLVESLRANADQSNNDATEPTEETVGKAEGIGNAQERTHRKKKIQHGHYRGLSPYFRRNDGEESRANDETIQENLSSNPDALNDESGTQNSPILTEDFESPIVKTRQQVLENEEESQTTVNESGTQTDQTLLAEKNDDPLDDSIKTEAEEDSSLHERTHKYRKYKGKIPHYPYNYPLYRANQEEDSLVSEIESQSKTADTDSTHDKGIGEGVDDKKTGDSEEVVGTPSEDSPSKSKYLKVPKFTMNKKKEDNIGRAKFMKNFKTVGDETIVGDTNDQEKLSSNPGEIYETNNETVDKEKPALREDDKFATISRSGYRNKSYDKVKAALEKLRAATKHIRKEIITEPPELIDDDDGKLGAAPIDSDKASNNMVEVFKEAPVALEGRTGEGLTSAEKTLQQLKSNANSATENILRSEPLESSFERMAPMGSRPEKIDTFRFAKGPSGDDTVLGSSPNVDSVESTDMTSQTNQNSTVSLSSRFKSTEDESWSKSLGKLIPSDDITFNNTQDIYFVGSGIKLPLNMVKKDDGALHLAVDVDKLCGCKNATCPNNASAIEETVGSILEKEAELKNELENLPENPNITEEESDEVLGVARSSIRGTTDVNGMRPDMKINDNEGFFSSELQHENAGILKRSLVDPNDDVESILPGSLTDDFNKNVDSIPKTLTQLPKIVKLNGRDFKEHEEDKTDTTTGDPTSTTTWTNLFPYSPSDMYTNDFKDFWRKSFDGLRSRIPVVNSLNPLSIPQQVFRSFSSPLEAQFEKEMSKFTTEPSVILQPKEGKPTEVPDLSSQIQPNFPLLDTFNPFSLSKQMFRNFLPTDNLKSENNITEPSSTPAVFFEPAKTPDIGSRIKNFFAERFENNNNEKFDRVTKVNGPYQFKDLNEQLEKNLKALDINAENHKTRSEQLLKDGADALKKQKELSNEEEFGIVKNFMNWLTGVSLRNETP